MICHMLHASNGFSDSMSGKKMGQKSSPTTFISRMVGLLCLLLFMIRGKTLKVNALSILLGDMTC